MRHFSRRPRCYNVSTLPSLLDGAVQAARLGSTSFKFALKGDMKAMYPFNNDGSDAWPAAFHSLADIVGHPQLQKLFLNAMQTGFDSYTLWAYRPGAPDSPY
eukprot:COSAG02_NODE_45015_length_361_cov_0.587786_1_plen_101_part_01